MILSTEILVALIAAIGAILVALVNTLNNIRSRNLAEKTHKKQLEFNAQMKPNGGSTIKDQLNRIENRLATHEERMLTLHKVDAEDRAAAREIHERMFKTLDAFERRLNGSDKPLNDDR